MNSQDYFQLPECEADLVLQAVTAEQIHRPRLLAERDKEKQGNKRQKICSSLNGQAIKEGGGGVGGHKGKKTFF